MGLYNINILREKRGNNNINPTKNKVFQKMNNYQQHKIIQFWFPVKLKNDNSRGANTYNNVKVTVTQVSFSINNYAVAYYI